MKIYLFSLLSHVLLSTGVESLDCHECGKLSEDPLDIQDCFQAEKKIVSCGEGEFCLIYARNYKQGSEPVQGCYPSNQSLPGLETKLEPSPTCNLQPEGDGMVSSCLCSADGCNTVPLAVTAVVKTAAATAATFSNLSMRSQDFIFPFDNSTGVSRARVGKQRRLQCYRCGSLFNRDSPACDRFDPSDRTQVTTCNEGEACLLYTWRKSASEIGSYRECFTTSILLGHPDYPIRPTTKCEPSRTQKDEKSSIRACLCTQDNCNILSTELATVRLGDTTTEVQPPTCPRLEVTGADYADCNGLYQVSQETVDWARQRYVYKHVSKDRYIFWNSGGLGWSIGKLEYLTSGSHWHRSGLDTREPWEGRWDGGVSVVCSEVGPPSDCLWSGYSAWSPCSATCGPGEEIRERKILQPPRGGGRPCQGSDREVRACTLRKCPRSCAWGEYGVWAQCSKSCGGGTRTRRREVSVPAEPGGRACDGQPVDVQFCNTQSCTSTEGSEDNQILENAEYDDYDGPEVNTIRDTCCNKVSVGATGNARIDQALYMGIYTRIENQFNGKPAYRREGRNPLYIYYFTSERDQLSLWVIGPELGQFIAGVRNSKPGDCVHDLGSGWKYASRAGVWEDNDPSLSVKCYEDRGGPTPNTLADIVDEVFTKIKGEPVDCQWSAYGAWSECTQSCNKGSQVRIRVVVREAAAGGKVCRGGNRQRRNCNETPCDSLIRKLNETVGNPSISTSTTTTTTTTTTTVTTTTITSTTTTLATTTSTTTSTTTTTATTSTTTTTTTAPAVRVPPPNRNPSRVSCYTCGSLYSTDAPSCPVFNSENPGQQKLCEVGEACLYYSWKTSDTDVAVIRECFPTSILLGSIDNPVDPTPTCTPEPVESDTIQACICTSDFCNGVRESETAVSRSTTTTTPIPVFRKPSSAQPAPPTTQAPERPEAPATQAPRRPEADSLVQDNDRGSVPEPTRSLPDRVKCHQCGSLFSTSSSDPNCKLFDESDPRQATYCKPGDACLWYSWQKSSTDIAHIRECFSTSILLGSISEPLLSEPTCNPRDISEDSTSKITACLCESDLCNAFRGPDEPRTLPSRAQPSPAAPAPSSQQEEPRRRPGTNQPTPSPFQTPFEDPDSQAPPSRAQATDRSPPRSFPGRSDANQLQSEQTKPNQNFHPDKPGLQCYSCGSLLNPNKKCDRFDPRAASQVQTCTKDEACLMYSWKKSSSEIATLRECFPTRVLLGSISDPLVPTSSCSQRDITDDNSGSIFACLCNTDFCNDEENSPFGDIPLLEDSPQPTTSSSRPVPTTTQRTTTTTTRRAPPNQPPTLPPTTRAPQSAPFISPLQGCPSGFQSVGGGCYQLSNDRVGWIEARKLCEQKGARLLSIETERKRADLTVMISTSTNRRQRLEFWLSGNDIEEEGVWEWAKTREQVPDFGWIEDPLDSPEENCLSWMFTDSSRTGSDSWQSSSCCNSLRYICEL